MHSQIPEPLKALVEQLARLPGLGPKSAMRVAMTLLKWPEAETRRLGGASMICATTCISARAAAGFRPPIPARSAPMRDGPATCFAWSRSGTAC